MSYRCDCCTSKVPAGQPQLKHIIWRTVDPKDRFNYSSKEVDKELKVCLPCCRLLESGRTLAEAADLNRPPPEDVKPVSLTAVLPETDEDEDVKPAATAMAPADVPVDIGRVGRSVRPLKPAKPTKPAQKRTRGDKSRKPSSRGKNPRTRRNGDGQQ